MFLLAGALPWSFVLLGRLKRLEKVWNDPWQLFLWLWVLWTPFFFTFSKSLIHTYTLPVMIPIALLIVHHWSSIKSKKTIIICGCGVPILLVGAYFLEPVQKILSDSTDKSLVFHPMVKPSSFMHFLSNLIPVSFTLKEK